MGIPDKTYSKYFIPFIRTFVIVLMFGMPALGAFSVKPMILELGQRPGKRTVHIFNTINESAEQTTGATLTICDVGQSEDGSWLVIEPNRPLPAGFDISNIQSCKEWIKLSKKHITVPPMGMYPAMLTLQTPPRIRGFYSAGILVTEDVRPDATGVALRMRYLVPVLVTIQGTAAPNKVVLRDISMESKFEDMSSPATTNIFLHIENSGMTFAGLEGKARLESYVSDHWWTITEVEYDTLGIFPSTKLKLKKDIERPLPSGRYRLIGGIKVDGRRMPAIGKDFMFVGDPKATKAAMDMKLDLDPTELVMETLPGATRSSSIRINNPSNDPLTVKVRLSIPKVLMGTRFGELNGADLSCVEWLEITPNEIKLQGHRSRTIRIIAKMPKVADPNQLHANYYAQLNLKSSYQDGLNAGLTTTNISVTKKDSVSTLDAVAMTLIPKYNTGSEYYIVASFMNTGNVHFTPRCYATIGDRSGSIIQQKLLEGVSGLMLPMEQRTFSATFDLSNFAADVYRLSSTMECDGKLSVNKPLPIRITLDGERRVVEVVGTNEFEAQAGVKWQ